MLRLMSFVFFFTSSLLYALPAQVLIIRHAEKPAQGNQLNTKGRIRAAALAPYFVDGDWFKKYGPPAAIYAQKPSHVDGSERPIETVTPLANALGQTLHTEFTHQQLKEMIQEVKSHPQYNGKLVLISWEHHAIPEMARLFGATTAPNNWEGDIFDRVWVIDYLADGSVNFQNIPQRLLFGDSPD